MTFCVINTLDKKFVYILLQKSKKVDKLGIFTQKITIFSDSTSEFLIVAYTAKRLIFLHFTQHHLFFAGHNTVRIVGQSAASHTDGVNFGYIVGDGAQIGHGAKWNALEIHVESGNDYTNALVG